MGLAENTFHVYFDDSWMGAVNRGGYVERKITPGKHAVRVTTFIREAVTPFEAEAGQSYFVEVVAVLGSHMVIALVPQEKGEQDIVGARNSIKAAD
jgi:hypothetical protein